MKSEPVTVIVLPAYAVLGSKLVIVGNGSTVRTREEVATKELGLVILTDTSLAAIGLF